MAAGVQRVLAKCQKCIDSGNFYEAHQMYRTLYFRYTSPMLNTIFTRTLPLVYTTNDYKIIRKTRQVFIISCF